MRISGLVLAAAMLLPAAAAFAQGADAPAFKVEFTLRDSTDAMAKSGRKYTLLMAPRVKSTMRMGNRVPVVTGAQSAGGNAQFTYFDVGVNIDCVVDERGGKYVMHADLDLSVLVPPEKTANATPNPTVSQIKLAIDTAVPPGKQTSIATFDDPATARKFDVDVTLTKI